MSIPTPSGRRWTSVADTILTPLVPASGLTTMSAIPATAAVTTLPISTVSPPVPIPVLTMTVLSIPAFTMAPTPLLLACLPTGAAAPTVIVASAGGGVARAVLFNLFALLLILRSSPGKCHRVQGGRHKDPIGHRKNKSGQRNKAHEIQSLNNLVNF